MSATKATAIVVLLAAAVGCRPAADTELDPPVATGNPQGGAQQGGAQQGGGETGGDPQGTDPTGGKATPPKSVEQPTGGPQVAGPPSTPELEKWRQMSVGQLVAALGDPADPHAAACDELAARGAEAVEPLIEVLGGDDADARRRAVFALGQIGPPAKAALPALQALAEGDDEILRDAAKFAIDAVAEDALPAAPIEE